MNAMKLELLKCPDHALLRRLLPLYRPSLERRLVSILRFPPNITCWARLSHHHLTFRLRMNLQVSEPEKTAFLEPRLGDHLDSNLGGSISAAFPNKHASSCWYFPSRLARLDLPLNCTFSRLITF